jgi:hypothetical protein
MRIQFSWIEASNAKSWAFNDFKVNYQNKMKLSLLGIVFLSFPYFFFSQEQLAQVDYQAFSIFGYIFFGLLPLLFIVVWIMVFFDLGEPSKFYISESGVYTDSRKHKGEYDLKFLLSDIESTQLDKVVFKEQEFYKLEFTFKPLRTIEVDKYVTTLSCDFVEEKYQELEKALFYKADIKQVLSESAFID